MSDLMISPVLEDVGSDVSVAGLDVCEVAGDEPPDDVFWLGLYAVSAMRIRVPSKAFFMMMPKNNLSVS